MVLKETIKSKIIVMEVCFVWRNTHLISEYSVHIYVTPAALAPTAKP